MAISLVRDCRGQILVLTAVELLVLFGFVALTVDAGVFFDKRRHMQTAADHAAVVGALEKRKTPAISQVQLEDVAREGATTNFFTHGADDIAVAVNVPPASGLYAGTNGYVEVLIDQPRPTIFMSLLGFNNITVRSRAVAGPGDGLGCVYALNPTQDKALKVAGGAVVDVDCGIVVNSNHPLAAMSITGSSSCVHAGWISVTGGAAGDCYDPIADTGVVPEDDPLGYLQEPTWSGCDFTAVQTVPNGTARIFTPGVYCGGIQVPNATASFSPGLYIIGGSGLHGSSHANLVGTGVTFFIYDGNLQLQGDMNLAAPTTGTWESILFFQSRSNTEGATVNSHSTSQVEGVLYFPAANMAFEGHAATNSAYTLLVSDTLTFTGHTTLNSDYTSLSHSPITKVYLAE